MHEKWELAHIASPDKQAAAFLLKYFTMPQKWALKFQAVFTCDPLLLLHVDLIFVPGLVSSKAILVAP